jgi:hypothetical protein
MDSTGINGSRWTKGLIAGVSMTLGLAVGIIGMGVWAGGVSAKIDNHQQNPAIHQTPDQKDAMVRSVIDREVAPVLVRMQRQLDRIEDKLDRTRR